MAVSDERPICLTNEQRRAALRRFVNLFKASRPEGSRVTFEVSTTDINAAIDLFLKEPDMVFLVRDETGAGQATTAAQLKIPPGHAYGMTDAEEIAYLREKLSKLA